MVELVAEVGERRMFRIDFDKRGIHLIATGPGAMQFERKIAASQKRRSMALLSFTPGVHFAVPRIFGRSQHQELNVFYQIVNGHCRVGQTSIAITETRLNIRVEGLGGSPYKEDIAARDGFHKSSAAAQHTGWHPGARVLTETFGSGGNRRAVTLISSQGTHEAFGR